MLSCLLLVACKENRFNVPGKPKHELKIIPFHDDFHTGNPSVDSAFLDLYATNVMQMGKPGSEEYRNFYDIYHNDPDIANLYDSCKHAFTEIRRLEKPLTWAFHRLTYFFPKMDIPKVYTHISFYGQSIISAPSMLSASLDKYLGADHPMYKVLFEPYQAQRMQPDKLLSDYMLGWIQSEFTPEDLSTQNRLLDHLLYEGRITFLTSLVLPDERLEHILSLTPNQLKWCKSNEKDMWDGIVQHQLLFSTDRQVISRFFDEAPTTTYFPPESPGRAITWIGFRIIERYMQRNQQVSIQELMSIKDAQELLNGSAYHP